MRVLILAWNYWPKVGGIESVVENLFRGLRSRGHEVALVTSGASGAPPEPHVFRAPGKHLPSFLLYAAVKGTSICSSAKPDLIVCGSLVTGPVACLLSRYYRLPFLVLTHGRDITLEALWYQQLARRLLGRATVIAANSVHTRTLLEHAGLARVSTEVIHPGVNTGLFARHADPEAESLLRDLEGQRVLLSVGRLIRRKGLLEFVDHVFPLLVKDHADLVLLIVGDDPTASLTHSERLKERLAARVCDLGLDGHVKLLGTISQPTLIHLYLRADIFVLPCLDLPGDTEGFGIVLLEAAAAGTPCVSTDVGGIPEAVKDGETGFLVRPGDFAGMRSAISRLLDDEVLRRHMAMAAADRARTLFDWEVIIPQYERAFERGIRAFH